ncbi:MAG: VOC family protein [Betaproteobacteria bacterium]|nr:MAG: VOC family protein [Betaproteobacteria bacterium]
MPATGRLRGLAGILSRSERRQDRARFRGRRAAISALTIVPRATLDHLVVAAETLEQGEDHLESVLGVRPRRGGKHIAMGTHNSMLRIGDGIYLELIAIDPDGIKPDRPRWFDLDRPSMRASLALGPRLIHWVARCADIEAARQLSPDEHGRVYPMTRGPYSWRITIPDDGHLPGEGLVPTLIQWADERHPVDALADDRIGLVTMAGAIWAWRTC